MQAYGLLCRCATIISLMKVSRRHVAVLASLTIGSIASLILLASRIHKTQVHTYLFLSWNLFLAWIPFVLACVVYSLYKKKSQRNMLLVLVAGGWLIFYPNAPYIMTDLIHLKVRDGIALWFDVVLLASFVWNGLLLGFTSLYLMQRVIQELWGKVVSWIFVVSVVGLSSLGIYMGRFLRWNSWDVVFNPTAVFFDVASRVVHPLANFRTFGALFVYSLFFLLAYVTLFAFSQLNKE